MAQRRKRLGRLEPEKNSRLAERLADKSFDTASEAVRLVRQGRCDEVVEKLSEASAFYGKADGHYANMEREDPQLEKTLGRAWDAVRSSSAKFRRLCVLRKK